MPEAVKTRMVNGFNRERSGDVIVLLKPNFYAHGMKGTDHGAWNAYDTHIPLVFMGWGVKHGSTTKPTFMTDIAPTIAALLHVQALTDVLARRYLGIDKKLLHQHWLAWELLSSLLISCFYKVDFLFLRG